jgi:hypothetical protein
VEAKQKKYLTATGSPPLNIKFLGFLTEIDRRRFPALIFCFFCIKTKEKKVATSKVSRFIRHANTRIDKVNLANIIPDVLLFRKFNKNTSQNLMFGQSH